MVESDHDKLQFRASMEFIDKMPVSRIKSIADVGSGPGHQAFVFSKMGLDVTCIDMIQPKYDLRWVTPDATEGLSFDAIWSHHCLEHIPDPIGALISWRKMLPVGGMLFVTVPEIGLTMSSDHINNFNIPMLVYTLAIAGFDTSTKRFSKSRSHLRAIVKKSSNYAPENEGRITDLNELASRGLFSPSITSAIEREGRFSAKDMHFNWFGRTFRPNRGGENAYQFIVSNLWK